MCDQWVSVASGDLASGVASCGEGGMSVTCLISFNNQCFNTLLR